MNHCPVYQNVGGQRMMGSDQPDLTDLRRAQNALDLHASTLCNQCGGMPGQNSLPDLMRKLRESTERGLCPWLERCGLALWSWAQRLRSIRCPKLLPACSIDMVAN
jgi:L-lactate utilization protein LutB